MSNKMTEKEIILSSSDIQKRVKQLGQQINKDFKGKEPLLIGVLNGAFIFMADLVRQINLPIKIDFIRVASYGNKTSPGDVTFIKDVDLSVEGKEIILVEDIIDTGRTISALKKHFQNMGASSVFLCTLIDKKERREVDISADYTGFEISQGFLVGYGLDFAEQHRCLPSVYHLINP